MKKTIIAVAASALLAIAGIAGATGPAGTSSVQSGSQIVLSAGVNGGSAIGGVLNRQTANIGNSTSYGAAGTVFGQSAGAAGVSGSGETSTLTMGAIRSTGAAGGEIAGGGSSQVTQSQANSYSTSNNVKGNVNGSLSLNSGSQLQAADNGGGVIGAGASAAYAASAQSTRTGIFSSDRTATTAAGGLASTTTPTTLNWGNSAFGLTNNSTITAGASAQSGTITSNNGNPGSGGNNGGNGGNPCGGNCGVGNGNGGGNGTGNEGNGNGPR